MLSYNEWLRVRREALDGLDDQYPTEVGAAVIASYMMEIVRDHMTDAGATSALGLDESAAEMAAEVFVIYDGSFVPGVLKALAHLVCMRIDGAKSYGYPPLPAQVVAQ